MVLHQIPSTNTSSSTLITLEDLETDEREKVEALRARRTEIMRQINEIKRELEDVDLELSVLETLEDRADPLVRHIAIGVKKFNLKPAKGLAYLMEYVEELNNDAGSVAKFLFHFQGLSKKAIGEYLGKDSKFNITVLQEFALLHNFKQISFIAALRGFLMSFHLPGEGQQIERCMDAFGRAWVNKTSQENNPFGDNPVAIGLLAYSCIWLNTSLHHQAVKDKEKMTFAKFYDMSVTLVTHSVPDYPIPKEELEKIYQNLETEPFQIPTSVTGGEDEVEKTRFLHPKKEGWLWKQGGRYKNWRNRYFILQDNSLYYFEREQERDPKGIIPLENLKVRKVDDKAKPFCFEVFSDSSELIQACKRANSDAKLVRGKHNVYRMSASSEEDRERWMRAISDATTVNPLLTTKKVHQPAN